MSTYFAILTQIGEAKLANAIALGATLKLKKMGVGDGNGNLPVPERTQKTLVREQRRADLNQLKVDPANASQIVVEQVLPEDVGGWWIREIGIYDEAGDLCAVANCPPSYKPLMAEGSGRTQVVRIVLIVASTAAIELKIDPSVVLATRKYVDDQDITVRAYCDSQLAKHLAAGDPHPQLAQRSYVDQQVSGARAYSEQQMADHLAAGDPHPQLAPRTYVDQQAAGARTYGDQQLGKHLGAADPHPQYSMKEVTTLPKFDASKKLVNSAFLQSEQGNVAGWISVTESRLLDKDDIGKVLYFSNAGLTITLPRPDSIGISGNMGRCIRFLAPNGLAGTVVPGPGVTLNANVDAVTGIQVKSGQYLTLFASLEGVWRVISSTAEMWRNPDFSSIVGASGMQTIAGRTILQRGQILLQANVFSRFTFPVAFPNSGANTTVIVTPVFGNSSGVGAAWHTTPLASGVGVDVCASFSGYVDILAIGH